MSRNLRLAILLFFSFLIPASAQVTLDQYNGLMSAPSPNGATGYFRVEQNANRWRLVTPTGHYLWVVGVYYVAPSTSIDDLGSSYNARILLKYGTLDNWGKQTTLRMKAWGFNAIGEYSIRYVLPSQPATAKMGFFYQVRPAVYSLTNRYGYGTGPVKDLVNGLPSTYNGYRGGSTPDVFDPNFANYVDGMLKGTSVATATNPWIIGVTIDDNDNIYGFGPGPEVAGAQRIHAHIGWIVLTGNFQQTANTKLALTYLDTKLYSKYALRDYLMNKYVTIAALNAAWGSNYTTFNSSGGWGIGTGLLDEDGRHLWVGKDYSKLSTAAPAVVVDLDAFLYQYAAKYFSVTTAKVRQYMPHHLVFGPTSMNYWNGLTRRQILQAAGKYLDVLHASVHGQQILDLTAKYFGNKPIMTWTGITANTDSALWRYPGAGSVQTVSQPTRATAYQSSVTADFNGKVSSTGIQPVIGTKVWAWADSWGEKANWGLVSFSDNAYDGKEAMVGGSVDPWGYKTGAEEKNYGNFIGTVKTTNQNTTH